MKRILKLTCLALTAMTMTFGVTACGDDDKKDEPNYPVNPINPGTGDEYHDSALIGTWELKDRDGSWWRYTFRANGTCRFEAYESWSDGHFEKLWDEYAWSSHDGELTFVCTSSSSPEEIGETWSSMYEVRGNILFLNGYMDEPYLKI